ncbi:MAG: 4-phosphopantetheinyl transferase superfamily protein [Mucilaginibacter sp.]|nr:4-phosphopantetheinyl transferase superfamily protein [Mucilaginibacter sp.]
MISTGNDIVALKAINIARTKQLNFYKKILSNSEKDLYDQQFSGKILLEHFVWLLWSVKESVFKYLQRTTPELVFSPTRVILTQLKIPGAAINFKGKLEGQGFRDEPVYQGVVIFGNDTLYSRSIIGDEFIFSVVNHQDSFEDTCWGIQLIDSAEAEYQSKAVREFLINRLNILSPGDDLQVVKSPHGYPVLFKDGVELPIPVSLAHHDHYVAYSFHIN